MKTFARVIFVGILVLISLTAQAATITSTTTGGAWSNNGTWEGGSIPLSTDDVIIATTGGNTVSITASINQSGSVTINNGAILIANTSGVTVTIGSLTIAGGGTLTMNRSMTISGTSSISGTINFGSTSATQRLMTFSGDVTLNAGTNWNETTTLAIPNFSFAGNFTNNSTTFTSQSGTHTFTGAGKVISGSTTTSIQNVAVTGTYTNDNILTVGTALSGGGGLTNSATGTINIGGTCTITTLTTTSVGNTVKYTGAAQTGKVTTYHFLTLSGSGVKTFQTSPTINGILQLEGTATITVTGGVVSYGANAGLVYNTASARNSSNEEWISPFVGTGGVKTSGTGIITLNGNKVFNNSVPLTIDNGATLATNNRSLTFGGDFVNNGTLTAGSSTVTITNTMLGQSIGGFTTTGSLSMTKTAGTATLTGNVNAASLTINGTGGTLNLGSGLIHTISGIWTRTAGTVEGGTSKLRLGSSVTNTGGTFTCNTGTVEYYASGTQTISVLTYYNLTLSGTSAKTFPTGSTGVDGTLSMEGSATASLTGTITYGASACLQYMGSIAQTTGSEFPASWEGSGGIKIENANGVNLNEAKNLNANPLVIGGTVANSVLNDLGFQITSTGTLNLNSGTLKLGAAGATSFPAFSSSTIASGTFVEYAATTAQTIKSLTYSNLTISGAGTNLKTADGNITVNGILNLSSANASATQGCLDMGAHLLNMGSGSTTTGTGDVTGVIVRDSFAENIPYTFGNQFTTLTLEAGGTMPTSLSVKVVLTTTHAFKADAVHRYYDIIQTGGTTSILGIIKLHYLDTELNGTTESNLDLFDYHVGGAVHDHSRASLNTTNNWVELTNLTLGYIAQSTTFDAKYWLLGTSATPDFLWSGGTSSDWEDIANWATGSLPTNTSNVVIPSGTTYSPTLPATANIKTMEILTGATVNATTGTPALSVSGAAGAWSNSGTFNAGASTVTFATLNASISGTTNFNNLTIADGASLTLSSDCFIGISGTISLSSTGILNANADHNTVEYNGTNQTVIRPNGSPTGYHNLILSGSGTKTMPGSSMSLNGDFTMSGTASATLAEALNIVGNVLLGSGTSLDASTYTHTISGDWTNNGCTVTGTGTISFNNTASAQVINGTAASQTFNNVTIAKSPQTLSIGGSTTTLSLNDLTITNGTFNIGTANTLNIAGNWSNGGTFTAGSGTVVFNGGAAQSISNINTFNNLTINNASGVSANADQTVNGILNLQSANASATQGSLDMGANTLNLGAGASTTGAGDVTGIVTRNSFSTGSYYSFGSQYTSINIASGGTIPSSISIKTVLVDSNIPWKTNAIRRYYDIIQTGADATTIVSLRLQYTDADLNGATEADLNLFDYHVTPTVLHDHGRSGLDNTNNYVYSNSINLSYLAVGSFDLKYWTVGTSTASDPTWKGTVSTNWNDAANWTGGIPVSSSNTIITTGVFEASLPSNITLASLRILGAGVLNDFDGYTLSISAGGANAWNNAGTFNAGNGTVAFTGSSEQTITGLSPFNNLTLSGSAGVKAGSNLFVNGILNLNHLNPSSSVGLMEMTIDYTGYPGNTTTSYLNSYILHMGTDATTIGVGDVTGIISRSPIIENTPYTFGNQYTTVALTTGTMPDTLQVTVTIGATPAGNPDAVARTYEIVPKVGEGYTSSSTVIANFHYLDSELTSTIDPFFVNTENNLVTMDYDIGGGFATPDEHGRSSYDFTNNYIGLSNIPISYFIQVPVTHAWRTLFQLRDYQSGYYTWDGSTDSNWGTSSNWTPVGVPSDLSNVIIPSALTTDNDPVLPDGTTRINTLTIQNGGVLTMGNDVLEISNSLSGGWEDQNSVGNNPGTSTVRFLRPGTAISGNASFYNVEIADTADITNQLGSSMNIKNTITRIDGGTGKWYADLFGATIEYSGTAQTVLFPDGTPSYHNLVLSGSGIKTMPASALSLDGNFTVSGTATATAAANMTINGNMVIGSGTSFDAATFTHTISGNWSNTGTFTASSSSVNFDGSIADTISGSTIFNNLELNGSGLTILTPGSDVTVDGTFANNKTENEFVIQSGANSNGSLIINNSGVSATVQRYMTKGKWHIISIPESGQSISSFLQSVPNSIGYNSTTSEWGMMPYNPTANAWSSFYTSLTPGEFEKGAGYMVRRKNSGSDGVVSSSGELYYGDFTITGLTPGKWNAVGNPYTSALGATSVSSSTSNLLDVNGTELETSFGAIYVWDEQADYNSNVLRNDYKVLNNSGFVSELTKAGLQSGQGFLVKMGTNSTDLIFEKDMQLHLVTEPYVKKSVKSWPGFELMATSKDFTNSAIVTFNDKMTKGLDRTYDAGAIKGNSKLSLYTRLLEDNGTDFLIQCLPLEGIEGFVIPVGLDFPDGGQITISAKTDLIEPGSFVILEDKVTGVLTDLVALSSGYTITLPASTYGTGRFYIHTGDGSSNSIPINKEKLIVYSSSDKIYINGEITQESTIMLYSTQGVLVRTYSPQSSNYRQLNADGLANGVYILRIRDKQFVKTYKLYIEKGL